MMVLKVDGNRYRVRFREITSCEITNLTENPEKYHPIEADVVRHPDDPPDHEKAAKYAFAKVLKAYPREIRAKFWKEYLGKTRMGALPF